MMGKEIVTDKSNKYYFWLCKFGENYTSKEYDCDVDCIVDFCNAIKTDENIWWGQFVIHHYADDVQLEGKEAVFTLSGKMSHEREEMLSKTNTLA